MVKKNINLRRIKRETWESLERGQGWGKWCNYVLVLFIAILKQMTVTTNLSGGGSFNKQKNQDSNVSVGHKGHSLHECLVLLLLQMMTVSRRWGSWILLCLSACLHSTGRRRREWKRRLRYPAVALRCSNAHSQACLTGAVVAHRTWSNWGLLACIWSVLIYPQNKKKKTSQKAHSSVEQMLYGRTYPC